MDIVIRIKEMMSIKGVKQKDIIEYLGESQSAVSKWLSTNEKNRNDIPISILAKIAIFLGTDTDTLLGIEKKDVKRVPIVGTASCGNSDTNHMQERESYAYYNGDSFDYTLYCVVANGDSMAPEIEDGDEVICNPDIEPKNGDMVHYKLFGESAIKIYFLDEEANIVQFIPYNPSEHFKTKTIRLDDDIANELKISKVVAVNKLKFNNRLSRLKLIGKA